MPNQKRPAKQHLRQESTRRRGYQASRSAPEYHPKPGFPMNIFGNVKLFAIIGVVVIVSFIVTAVITFDNSPATEAGDLPSPTATPTLDPNATPTPTSSPTREPLQFTAAEDVTAPETKSYRATLQTSMGDIVLELLADEAPNTVNSFVFLAQEGYFDGITFHRVSQGFVIQSGDPTGSGSGGPGYTTADEPNEISNTRGTVSMAKVPGQAVFGSQFFINLKDNTSLDYNNPSVNKFYPWARVIEGMDVVDAIGAVALDRPPDGAPLEDVILEDVVIEETDK